ncbi:MAG: hypothetical protein ACLGIB_11880 [Actinomycetota bacterium]
MSHEITPHWSTAWIGRGAQMMLLGIALFVLGMAVSIGAPSDANDARLLEARGVDTTATVTDVTIRQLTRRTSPYAEVAIAYEDELGLPREDSGLPYCGEADEAAVGMEVEITYDPDDVVEPRFVECPGSQEVTIPLVIGVVVLGAGTFTILAAWRARGLRRRWLGVPIAIVGVLFMGTALDEECRCREAIYTGGGLAIIGTAGLVLPRKKTSADASMPEGAPGET